MALALEKLEPKGVSGGGGTAKAAARAGWGGEMACGSVYRSRMA